MRFNDVASQADPSPFLLKKFKLLSHMIVIMGYTRKQFYR